MPAPLNIEVYDKTFVRKKYIGAPIFVTVIPRHNLVGSATVCLLASDEAVAPLFQPGARMWIRDENDEHLMSGYVTKRRGRIEGGIHRIEFDIEDDFALLRQVLGWVVPTAPITGQGSAGDNWVLTDDAETVVKTAMQVNAVDRLGLPLSIEASAGRGSVVTAKLRFHPIFDRLFPVEDGAGVSAAGVGFDIRQDGAGFRLSTYVPRVYPRDLTTESGIVRDYSYNVDEPTVTRAVVGGQGEAQARVFRHVIDAGRETEIARILEIFRDARDTPDVDELYERGQESIDEGGRKAGLSMSLSETPNFRYGKSVRVGDQISIKLNPDLTITDVLNEATLSWTREGGWRATPKVGERSDSTDLILAKGLSRLYRALSNRNRT